MFEAKAIGLCGCFGGGGGVKKVILDHLSLDSTHTLGGQKNEITPGST